MESSVVSQNITYVESVKSNEGRQLLSDAAERRPLGVALIGPSTLFGEVLVSALAAAEPGVRFRFFTSLDDWLVKTTRIRDQVLLLFLGDGELISPEKSDLARLEAVKNLDPAPRFIICASQEDRSQVLKALELGAEGYVVPDLNLKVLIQVIHLVNAGGVFVPASSLKNLSATPQSPAMPDVPSMSGLSPRQILVAKALRKGTPNKVIAYELNMCESTVKVHVRHIMKKLHAKNRTQIAFLTNAMFAESEKN